MKWSCGLTTCPERKDNLLPATLHSLKNAGFTDVRLFVDGVGPSEDYRARQSHSEEKWWGERHCGEITTRRPRIKTAGNWMLGLMELYIREPNVDRYAMFQDDLLACKGLREYLERTTTHKATYWNLYTFPMNEEVMGKGTDGKPKEGWHPSNQRGKGAVALVFTNESVRLLLSSRHMIDRCDRDKNPNTCWRNIDGGIVTALAKVGVREMVHHPTLVMHTGITSSLRGSHVPYEWQATSFRGESFDLMTLLHAPSLPRPASPAPSPSSQKELTMVKSLKVLELPHFGWLPNIRHVQVQTHSRCNADCLACPYVESAHANEPGRMTDETWHLILSNLRPFTAGINAGKTCPYLMQEPLIDPSIFVKITDIYRCFPQTCVEVSTNGAALTEKVCRNLLDSMRGKRHDIWVSHHGTNAQEIEHIMKIDGKKAEENLVRLLKMANGRFAIKVRGMGASRDGKHHWFSKEQYLDWWQKLVKDNGINPVNVSVDWFTFHDRAGTLHRTDRGANTLNMGTQRLIDLEHPFHCPRVDEWVHFMWDGQIRLCCMDYHAEVQLPNIHQTSLLDYFHSDEYMHLVMRTSGRVDAGPGYICARCTSPGG